MDDEKKISLINTLTWMVITGCLVYAITYYQTKKSIADDIKYYNSVYDNFESYSGEFEKLKKVMGIVERDYLKEYDVEKLEEGAINGLLDALEDPYTSYFNKSDTESFLAETEGEYEGVGMYIVLDVNKDTVMVLQPIKDSPAKLAGVLAGDYIMEVNGTDVTGSTLEEVARRLKGIAGTEVNVTFKRYNQSGDEEIIKKTITRQKVELTEFEYNMMEGNIGYVTFASFDENIENKFEEAYKELFKNQKAKALILDLRNNPGGLLTVATKLADKLLPTGKIVYTVDRDGKEDVIYSDSSCVDVPIIVLVNENSASASEIMAAAVKDYGGKIVGKTTYGKGLVQEFRSLKDGTYIKVTISEYFSPNGNQINEIGVKPDYEVEENEETEADEQLQKALEVAKELIK